MTISNALDVLMARLDAGGRLTRDEVQTLADGADILPLGVLADTARRVRCGTRATYLRVAWMAFDAEDLNVPGPAREIELAGSPASLDEAVVAVRRAASAAGGRCLSAFSWADVERFAAGAERSVAEVLARLREAGLDALASTAIDEPGMLEAGIPALAGAGFSQVRLSVKTAAPQARAALFMRAAELQAEHGCIAALDPLPRTIQPSNPTTGYEDVKMVAVARLAAPEIAVVQLDWRRYGPKLAQVALTFGGNDVHGIAASDEAPEGRRRAPLEEIRRNIEAAGFEPVERDGRFSLIG